MTIVIAKKFKNSLIILSDTKITYDPKRVPSDRKSIRSNPTDGILKTIILFSDLCISFAGDTKIAYKIINQFEERLANSPDFEIVWDTEKCAHLLHDELLKEPLSDEVEFILCVSKEDKSTPELAIYKISSKIQKKNIRSLDAAWIGDKEAFSQFQKFFHTELNRGTEKKSAFSGAFYSLIRQQKILGIGDFLITTAYEPKHGFCYRSRVCGRFTFRAPEGLRPGEEVTIGMGTAENGDYCEVYFESLDLSTPAIGLHFPHGNFGIFFLAPEVLLNEGQGRLIPNVDAEGFLCTIANNYKIPMKGFEMREDSLHPICSTVGEVEWHTMSKIAACGSWK